MKYSYENISEVEGFDCGEGLLVQRFDSLCNCLLLVKRFSSEAVGHHDTEVFAEVAGSITGNILGLLPERVARLDLGGFGFSGAGSFVSSREVDPEISLSSESWGSRDLIDHLGKLQEKISTSATNRAQLFKEE